MGGFEYSQGPAMEVFNNQWRDLHRTPLATALLPRLSHPSSCLDRRLPGAVDTPMTTWVQLPKDKAHSFYRVPLELTARDENCFFAAKHHPLDTDGPWPFLAFLKSESHKGILTFQIFTIEAEALESKGFNPLTETCGYLFLRKRQLSDLVRLLLSYAETLPSPPTEQPMLKPVEPSRLRDFHISSPLLPNSRDYFYYQTYDPMGEPTSESIVTLLILSTAQGPRRPSGLYFKIAQFPLSALKEPSFNVLDDSLPKIHLNRNGIEELARILELQRDDLVEDG